MKPLQLAGLAGGAMLAAAMPANARTACAEMSAAPLDGVTITSAAEVDATEAAPAHCEILAQIAPADPEGWPINLRVVLPEDWSGHAVQFGGGGFNGTIPQQAGGRWQTPAAAQDFPFKGHATFSGDSGHSVDDLPHGPDIDVRRASFALNQEAFERYARRSVNETYGAAMQIIEAHYGTPADLRYFVGFSQGGKEAMVAAQDHPEDYDGILVGDPVANLTGLKIAHLQSSLGFYRNGGAGWVGPELAQLVTDAVYAQCDPQDGLEDGWIADFEGCEPDLSSLLCAEGETGDCLTEAQLEAVMNVARPVELDFEIANGLTGHAGYPWGNTAWQGSFAGSRPVPSRPGPSQDGYDSYVYTLGDGYARFFIAQDPEYDTLGFDPNDPALRDRIVAVSQILDATNPDLSGLRDRGGRMILYAGGASEVPPAEVAAYWTRVNETMGADAVTEFARFYIFPSINHGGVGPEGMPNRADLFSVLETWVTEGTAPGDLVNSNDAGTITRPLCQYPAWPQYQGGDESAAESFACVP
ncbi:tannase/feruloyl esterase family alpha/beta hydrolase [Plastorhodobacter daqingensis]|uniref:Tannase/feruloyl esterase family alpha/beta hydrolase n=1 Tax=Plastorhodobacter daqingensis TaxID=1387281 RepID=A0ABW2UJG4_9RHOB